MVGRADVLGGGTFKDAFVGGDTLVYVRWNITFD